MRTLGVLVLVLVAGLGCVSCERIKSFSEAIRQGVAGKDRGAKPSKADASLQALVDPSADGVVFRKDLPFPTRLTVTTTRRHKLAGRFYQSSEIQKDVTMIEGNQVDVWRLELAGPQLRYIVENSGFTAALAPGRDEGDEAVEVVKPAVVPVTFRKFGHGWQADERGSFRAIALAKALAPRFEELLVANALAPRPLWFAGQRRFKVGDEVLLKDESLAMITGPSAKGTCKLKLESFEAVEGHPCGVFAITGDYSRTRVPDFEGNLTDEDISIQSGRIWCSLIHPLILKEELNTIQTLRSGGQGGLVSRGQGVIEVSVTRVWVALDP